MNSDTNFTFSDATFEDAIDHLRDLKNRRRDIIARFPDLYMTNKGDVAISEIKDGNGQFKNVLVKPNDHAQRQISTRLSIPWKYWNRMNTDLPHLAAANFNTWLEHERETQDSKERKVFVRSYMDEPGGNIGTMRALLSNSYMPIDNLTLISQVLEVIGQMKQQHNVDIKVSKCSLSDTRLYLKFISPSMVQQTKDILKNYRDPNNGEFGGLGKDNGIVSGFVVTNSEVGVGSLAVSPMLTMKACLNNMIWRDEAFSRRHVGSRLDVGIFKDDTKNATIESIKLQIRDHVAKFLHPDFFGQQLKHIEEMAARRLEHPIECTRNMGNELGLSDNEIDSVLNTFLRQGANENVFDVAQAFTAFAHHQPHDKKIELESASVGLLSIVDKCDVAKVKVEASLN